MKNFTDWLASTHPEFNEAVEEPGTVITEDKCACGCSKGKCKCGDKCKCGSKCKVCH